MNRSTFHRSGFTLLEIMLAVTILGLLVIAVSSVWSAGLSGWKRSHGLTETLQRQRITLDSLGNLVQSTVYFQERNQLYAIRGEHDPLGNDSISFVTASDELLAPNEATLAGLRRVTIRVQQDTGALPALIIENAPALQPTDKDIVSVPHVLAQGITGFNVRYRTVSGEWKDRWEQTDKMPYGIEFAVGFAPANDRSPAQIVSRKIDLPSAKLAGTYQPPGTEPGPNQ